MINGNDAVSLKVITELNFGKSVAQVSEEYGITVDQGKKLSRLMSMREKTKALPTTLQDKFIQLGLKGLVLAPLFKLKDMDGLQDILQSIDQNIKRDTLAKMLLALGEKRKHVEEAKKEIQQHMRGLEYKEKEINNKIEELHRVEVQLGEIFIFLQNTTQQAKDFLMEHLGVKDENIVLAKRLYYTWQQELKRSHVIEFDYDSYSWLVKDINKLIEATEKKFGSKRSRKCMYFDPKRDPWNTSAEYKKVTAGDANLTKLCEDNENEIEILNKERKELLKSIGDIKSKSAMSYMEAVILANQISAKDIETHALVQDQGMKWLFEQGYVCATELSMDAYRFDVIGYNKEECITIIEAKASREDFQRDGKWQNYLKYCNKFYFIFHQMEWGIMKKEALKQAKDRGAGILIVKGGKRVEMITDCSYRGEVVDGETLKFNTARACSKKIIYGY